jgi:predicted N-acetyltransferase YhbS
MIDEVREATAEDDRAIGELLVDAFEKTYARKLPQVVMSDARRAELRDVKSKRAVAKVWVCARQGKVVGTVAVWPAGAPGSEAWIMGAVDLRHLAVDDGHRGGEVSRGLLDAAERHARQTQATAVCLHVRRGAVGVRRLYESRGYRRRPEGDLDFLPEVFLEAFALPI